MAQYQPMYDSFNRMPDRYVPTARISVSPNVRLPSGDIDLYTGQPKPDHQRRHRTQAQRLEREEIDAQIRKRTSQLERESAKGGVRVTLLSGMLIIFTTLFVCSMILLFQCGQISACQEEINQQRAKMDAYRTANRLLSEQIAQASDPSVICYAASRNLNMIPSESVEAIHLPAVDTRPLETAKQQKLESMQSVQPTPIPMTASN